MTVTARIRRVAHFVGDLVNGLVALVAIGHRQFRAFFDVDHE